MHKRYKSKNSGGVYTEIWSDHTGALLADDNRPPLRSWWTSHLIKEALVEIVPDMWVVMNINALGEHIHYNKAAFNNYARAKDFTDSITRSFPTQTYYVAKLVKCNE